MSSGNRSTASRVSFAPVAPSGCPSY
jgi:hypothetical protein